MGLLIGSYWRRHATFVPRRPLAHPPQQYTLIRRHSSCRCDDSNADFIYPAGMLITFPFALIYHRKHDHPWLAASFTSALWPIWPFVGVIKFVAGP